LIAVFVASVFANNQLTRTVNAPVCTNGDIGCTLTARDQLNGQNRNTNISSVRLDTSGNIMKAIFTYQGSTIQGQAVPVSAGASVTFLGVYEWHDTNGDNVPDAGELSNEELFSPANKNWQTAPYGSGSTAGYMPFSTGLTFTNFSASCYIVKNDTFFVPPDFTSMSGYGAICRLHVTKSQPIAAGNRVALIISVGVTLQGGGVDTTSTSFLWSIFTSAMGKRIVSGGAYVMYGAKAQPAGSTSSTAGMSPGPWTSANGEQQLNLGLVSNDAYSFNYDIAFEPVDIVYSGATSVTVSLLALLSIVCVALFQ